jgi:hypothetical protein
VILDKLIIHAPEMIDKAICATAFDVAANAIAKAKVDTGAMKASIFIKTSKGSDISEAEQATNYMNPDAEFSDPTPGKPPLMHAYIAPGVNYAFYQEFGKPSQPNYTYRPFLTPAMEKAEEKFEKYMKKIFGELK